MVDKACTTCGGVFPEDAFYKNGNNKGGRAHKCSTCSKEYSRAHRVNHHYAYYAYKYRTTQEIIKRVS